MSAKTSLCLTLTKTNQEKKWEIESLGELLDQAARILAGKFGDDISTRRWLARNALRAVCKAVIREGHCFAPIEVAFITGDQAPANVVPFKHLRN